MMKQSSFAESPIDHHIQRDILQALFKSHTPTTFSDLKSDDIDNSLFMYHMRKLTNRGLIEKVSDGYVLTADGARRINFVSTDTLRPDLNPRILVSFLALDETRAHILLSRRTSSAARYLGEYLIPAGRLQYGQSLNESIRVRLNALFGVKVDTLPLGTYETIITARDDYIHHTLSFANEVVLDKGVVLPREAHYELVWVSVDAAADGEYGNVVQAIVRHYLVQKQFNRTTFTVSL